MKIHGKEKLTEFYRGRTDAKQKILSWVAEVERAAWRMSYDITSTYRTASPMNGGRVYFNICGGRYRLEVKVNFKDQIVLVTWVGTHKEYDKRCE